MEATIKEIQEEKKGKSKWPSRIINFLAMGGFILVLVAFAAMVILISFLTR
jgi:hypothetical protein